MVLREHHYQCWLKGFLAWSFRVCESFDPAYGTFVFAVIDLTLKT